MNVWLWRQIIRRRVILALTRGCQGGGASRVVAVDGLATLA